MHAHYATTTPFYRHVVSALSRHYEHVSLQRRFQLDERAFERIRPILPQGARKIVARRVQPSVEARDIRTLRRWSYEPAIYARLGRTMPLGAYRSMISSTAREVRKHGTGADILQFTDGIGYLAMRDGTHQVAVMERRHVHHDVLREPMSTWRGFPVRTAREPIPDVLDEEYESADLIVVYSDAARKTFLDRGFDPDKVHTVHRGATPLPAVSGVPRDPRLAVYVGRGDADKGLDLAVGAVEAQRGGARLKVAGPLTREVIDWLKPFSHVEYVGILDRPQLARLYASATLLLMPSIESFGLAMTDAASAGVYVVCSDTAGIGPEFGPGFSAVVREREVEAWSAAVARAMDEESDATRATRESSGMIQATYSWANSKEAMSVLHSRIKRG